MFCWSSRLIFSFLAVPFLDCSVVANYILLAHCSRKYTVHISAVFEQCLCTICAILLQDYFLFEYVVGDTPLGEGIIVGHHISTTPLGPMPHILTQEKCKGYGREHLPYLS